MMGIEHRLRAAGLWGISDAASPVVLPQPLNFFQSIIAGRNLKSKRSVEARGKFEGRAGDPLQKLQKLQKLKKRPPG
ncbi:MAG: hypothetical protein WBV23_13865, partial [Desulfobaccales bacterium]